MRSRTPSRGGEAAQRGWDLKEIRELIDVLIEREITEFEMERGGLRIRIRRGNAPAGTPAVISTSPNGNVTAVVAPPAPSGAVPMAAPAPASAPPTTAPAEASAAEAAEGLYIIKSPIVGTFYAASAPNAPPFVKLGDQVEVGQVVCIIEAMKLMNEIESEVAGEVVRIYAENGQPVEYGQSLFAIKPSHKK